MTSPRLLLASLSLLLAAGCAAPAGDTPADEEVGEAEEALLNRTQNTHNSLLPQTLFDSTIAANPLALDVLSAFGLQTAMSFDYMQRQLSTSSGAAAFSYIASCALDPKQAVTTRDPIANQSLTFPGEVGLCPGWLGGPPSTECQELVSACVLARVNAVGVRVPISLHGAGVPASDVPLPQTVLKNGAKIASFASCRTRTTGEARSCGWWPVGVGTCDPGMPVTIGAGANVTNCGTPLGAANFDAMLRVCNGIYGCDADPTRGAYAYKIAGNDDNVCGGKPSVTFTCPSSGFYSVMGAAWDSNATPAQPLAPSVFSVTRGDTVGAGFFPAQDSLVFPYVEGAFYGNIFDSSNLNQLFYRQVDSAGVLVVDHPRAVSATPLYRNAFSCYSSQISDGAALLAGRVCTYQGCLMNVTGACRAQAPGRTGPTNRCESFNTLAAGEYDNCHDATSAPPFTHPLTTYLHNACDTITAPGQTPPASCQLNGAFNPLIP